MAESVIQMRRRAVKQGIDGARGMSPDELRAALNGAGSSSKRKVVRKKVSKKVTKPAAKATKKNVRKATRKPAAAKQTRKPATRASNSNGDGGRNMIGRVNFSNTEGWNPREGGSRHTIWLALKKAKGDRDKAYNALLSSINDHVPARKGDGSKRTKAEKQAYLRYQVNRVLFDFVTKTGQHEISSNRVEYGTGGTGAGVFKRAKGAKQSTRKPAKAQKRSQSRTKPAAKKRGRPKGSKNRK